MAAHLISAKTIDPGNETYVTCVARGKTLEVLREKGLSFRKPGGKEAVYRPDFATDNAAALPEQKLIVLCVKGYDLTAACEAIRPLITPETKILPLLNGIDIYERIRRLITTGLILPACIYIASSIQAPGSVVHSGGQGNIIAGADPRHKDYNPALLASLMAAAGIPFVWEADPFPALWTKYFFIASYALVTGLSGKSFGQILEDKDLSASVMEILKEIHAIAAAKGVKLPESLIQKSYESAGNFPYEATTSYARDLQVPGKPNEADLFGGTILRLGEETGVPTPATKAIYEAILKKA
jgi:2-dehydropantoate 2-reductase